MQDYLNLAKKSAKKAGRFLIENKEKFKEVNDISGRDIKLQLDIDTEKLIRKELACSNLPVLGEELGGLESIESGKFWVIDPIDGTANYFRGLDQCCVSIALMERDVSLIGVIYNFNNNELYAASKNNGAFLNDKKITVSEINEKKQASLTTGFPASEEIESSIDFLDNLKYWKKIRMFGSAALSCAYVASGKCDFYSEKGVFLWDFAAGICLVEEAGGKADFKLIDKNRYSVKFSNNLL